MLLELLLALSQLAVLVPGAKHAENGRVFDFELECERLFGVYDSLNWPVAVAHVWYSECLCVVRGAGLGRVGSEGRCWLRVVQLLQG